MQRFLDLLSSLDPEDGPWPSLHSALWEGNDVTLRVLLRGGGEPEQRWDVRCADVRSCRVAADRYCASPTVVADHPVLLPHVSPVLELFFRGAAADPHAIIGGLLEAHQEVAADWFDVTRFLNARPGHSLRQLLAGGFASFATGPKPLIDAYSKVLGSHGLEVSTLAQRGPIWWDGENWVDETKPLSALVWGSTFVVSPLMTAVSL